MTTSITKMITWLHGSWVGQDFFGNNYYEQRRTPHEGRRKRWVVYANIKNNTVNNIASDDASLVAPNWHRWLHYSTDDLPENNDSRYQWQQAPESNLTGTAMSLYPQGALPSKQTQNNTCYQPWQPSKEKKLGSGGKEH